MRNIIDIDKRLGLDEEELVFIPPIIRLSGVIDEESARDFQSALSSAECDALRLDLPVIFLVVDSYGGDVYSAMTCLDAMDTVKRGEISISTVLIGKAMSAGAAIFSAGSKGWRFMSKNSTIMIHAASGGGHGKTDEVETNARELRRLQKSLLKKMAEYSGQPAQYFDELIKKANNTDVFITSQNARRHGLADHIKVPTIRTTVSLNYSIE